METYYDDERVTLCDGSVDVEQIGGIEKVAGSRDFVRDPRLSPLVKGRRGSSRPDYGTRVPRIPTDQHGKPMRFCSGGHYAPYGMFGKRQRNLFHGERDGLDDVCTDCRKLQRHRHNSNRSS